MLLVGAFVCAQFVPRYVCVTRDEYCTERVTLGRLLGPLESSAADRDELKPV